MRQPSWYKVLENAREASLELAAACAEGYAELRRNADCGSDADSGDEDSEDEDVQTRARRGFPDEVHCRDRGDFLSDWMRLNLQYMNQVAMLSSSYASVVARGLGVLYSRSSASAYAAGGRHAQRCEVELCGCVGDPATARVHLRNSRCDEETLEIRDLVDGKLSLDFHEIGGTSEKKGVSVHVADSTGRPYLPRTLESGERVTLVLRLFLKDFEPNRRYRAKLRTRLGGHSKAIFLIVQALP